MNLGGEAGPAVLAARAEQLLELGRAAEARSQIARVLAAEPGNAQAQRLFVRCLLQLDDPRALDAAKRAIVLAPDNDQSHRLAALAHTKSGLHDLAVQHAREAVRLAPHEWRTHHMLTHALIETDPAAALAAGRDGVRTAPHEPAVHLAVGLAALKARDNGQAKESFRTALSLDPDNATARNNLAIADLRTGRIGTALDGFGAALAADPQLGQARRNLDAVTVSLLMKLRLIMIASGLIAFQLVTVSFPDTDRTTAGTLLAGWAVLAGWGYSRIPARLRGYSLGVFRRSRRAAVSGVAIAVVLAGVVIGPLLGVVSTQTGLVFIEVAWFSLLADAIWYSRSRDKRRARNGSENRVPPGA